MKRCPECRRNYYDDTLLYCLDDGNALLDGPTSGSGAANELETILSDINIGNEPPTRFLGSSVSPDVRPEEGFWVAVLPFKFSGSVAEIAALADGLSEGIVTGLSRFSYLRVISRSSTMRYSNDSDDVRAIGKELGAR
jgi:hypothetical protein